jgi:CheY-like chemotaxis protein
MRSALVATDDSTYQEPDPDHLFSDELDDPDGEDRPARVIVVEEEPDPADGRPPRMLVADDDEQFREMLREWLQDEGVEEVFEARDGSEAVKMAMDHLLDVILMDMRMPKMDGIEAASQIKEKAPNVQVIMVSAYGDAALREAAEKAGVYSYVVKGGPPNVLWHTIRFAWTYKARLDEERVAGSENVGGPENVA